MALGLTIKIVMTFERDKYILGDPEVDILGGIEVIGWAKIGYKQVLKTFFHLPIVYWHKLFAQGSLGDWLYRYASCSSNV